jgi:hypothetical protein
MYKVISRIITDKNGNKKKSYGISYNGQDYPDLKRTRKETRRLVYLCNKLKLEEVHIQDVLDDFIKYGVE